MIPKERMNFQENLKTNLLRKYQLIHNDHYQDLPEFDFSFDPEYIANRNGKISKLIKTDENVYVKAMEAPFYLKTNPELIRIAYACGLGEKNSMGFWDGRENWLGSRNRMR